jgi:hypothetical protein
MSAELRLSPRGGAAIELMVQGTTPANGDPRRARGARARYASAGRVKDHERGGVVGALGLSLVTLLIGAFLGLFISSYVLRPKLRATGFAGGMSAQIQNEPGLLGVKVDQTIIFGKQIHEYHEFGIPIDRGDALDSRAYLFEKLPRRKRQKLNPWTCSTGRT